MHEIPSLIRDLALILMTAGVVTLLFKRLKQPLVLGYIVAGFIVSPNLSFTMSVVDKANIQTWADIGVMFLLFTLGLDFSFKKIVKMGIAPVIAVLTIIFSMMMIGIFIARMLGWSQMNGLFLAGMLAMSSTTIIYKAFDDLGLRQQQFSSLVMSVLILEDVLAIVMMVILTTIAKGGGADVDDDMLGSVLSIVFFLVLWFVVGLFFVPTFLRAMRSLINDEVLLIVSLALCCSMAVGASLVGFSPAFGSFVMGSILAETIEAKKIERIVEPVKNLFGAIFFVSVGMLVDITIVIQHWSTILIITLAIIFGQSIFGTIGFMLSGQSLKTAMRCSFSMAQIGEFAFILASLGLSLGVMADFLYPVVVTVSVITTFLTPYMIRGAIPAYNAIERRLPRTWISRINKISDISPANYDHSATYWRPLLISMGLNVLIYSVLSIAIILFMLTLGKEFIASIMPTTVAKPLTALLTTILISPFLRAMVMKKNHSEEFKALWTGSRHNRLPLLFTVLARFVLAIALIFYVLQHLLPFSRACVVIIAIAAICAMIYSRALKSQSIKLERLFIQNLRSKDIAARASGRKRPLFEGRLLERDIHIADLNVPIDSLWAGKQLAQLNLPQRFGVVVSAIRRGHQVINIPLATDMLFPGDSFSAIGTDEQLTALAHAIQKEQVPEDFDRDMHEMLLRRFVIGKLSPFLGESLLTCGLRTRYNCMLVGLEEGAETLTKVVPTYRFQLGDILWIVGKDTDIQQLANEI